MEEILTGINTLSPTKWNKLKNLFSIQFKGGAIFNPKKSQIAYISNEKGVAQLFTQQVTSNGKLVGVPKQILSTKDRCTYPSYLEDGSLIFLHDKGGSENFQIGHVDVNSNLVWATNSPNSSHIYNYVSKNFLYYTSNERTRLVEVFRKSLPIKTDSPSQLVYSPSKTSVATISFAIKDKLLFIEQSYSNLHSEIILKDLNTNKTTSLTNSIALNQNRRWSPIRFINKKKTILLVKTDYMSDFHRLALLVWNDTDYTKPAKFVTIPQFETIKADFKSIETKRGSNSYYIALNMNGYSKLIHARLNSFGKVVGKVITIQLPLARANIVSGGYRSFSMSLCSHRNLLAITLTNSVTPTSTFVLDIKGGKSHKLFHALIPKSIKSLDFVSETLGHFASWDKLKIPFFLYKPHGEVPQDGFPTIILLHGGPEAQSKPEFSPLVQFLVASGFIVVEPNIRGSNGYGRKYLDLDNREKRMHAIRDVKWMTRALKQMDFIDMDKLVVMGGSYGGYASLMSIVTYPKLFRAGIDIVGMSNLVTFLQHTAKWRRVLREPEYGYLESQRKFLKKISPIHYVQQARAPVYIIQGANDPRVPVSEAKQMYKKLKQVGKTVPEVSKSKLLILKNEGHGFSKRSNRFLVYHSLMTWLYNVLEMNE